MREYATHCIRIFSRRDAPSRGALLFILAILSFTGLPSAAPKRPLPRAPAAKPETVYVASPTPAPAPVPAREMRAPEPVRQPEGRRTEAAFSSPLREFPRAAGGYGGFYVAEVLGNTPFATAFYELYPAATPFFFQFGLGAGTVQSGFSEDVVGGTYFDKNLLLSLDALGGYSITGMAGGTGRGGGMFPYFLAGITAFWQGGLPIMDEAVPNIGGVIGFGNRTRIPFFGIDRTWAFNYVVRDNIYSQKLKTIPSLTQSFALLIGIQKYW